MKKNHKRISAAVLSLALGFSVAGAPVLAPMAAAQQTAYSTVDLSEEVSLTINKYEGLPVEGDAALGQLPRLEGFDFLIQRVNDIDLSTSAGWEDVANLDPADTAGLSLTTIDTITTNDSGVATIDSNTLGFEVGVYLVTEQQQANYTVAPPFFVTLPFTDSETGGWNYSQVVHPKNQLDINIEKDVEDLGVTLNDQITYTISAPLPAGNLTELQVVDNLQSELGQADEFNVYVDYLGGGTAASESFIQDTDYTVSGNFELTFTAVGLAKLQGLSDEEENTQLELFVEFETTVTSLPDNGVIENHASIDFGGDLRYSTDPEDEDGPDEPGTGTQTRFGELAINKINTDDEPIAADADFQLYRCNAVDPSDPSGYSLVGGPLSAVTDQAAGTVEDTFTTGGVDGQITLYGVQVLDWVNGEESDTTVGEDLCVVETSAPTGYVLNPEPQQVEFVDAEDPDNFDMVVTVTNLEQDGAGPLPETGGQGTMALIAGGLLVAVAGGFAALRGNRARG